MKTKRTTEAWRKKPVNPYVRLRTRMREYLNAVYGRSSISMLSFEGARMPEAAFKAYEIFERVSAAQQLGFTVQVCAVGDDLEFRYMPKLPDRPVDL